MTTARDLNHRDRRAQVERNRNLNTAQNILVELDAVVERIADDYEITTEAALPAAALVVLGARLEALTRGLT